MGVFNYFVFVLYYKCLTDIRGVLSFIFTIYYLNVPLMVYGIAFSSISIEIEASGMYLH